MTDDIRDLLGRYATGSLSQEQNKRLFDAALDDQELFEELAREDEMKQLFAGPGVRDRMIRALEPPKRKVTWLYVFAPVAMLTAILLVVFLRPVPQPQPQPQQVAVATTSAPPAAPAEPALSDSQPVAAPEPVKAKRAEATTSAPPEQEKKTRDAAPETALKKDAENRATDQKEAAPKAMDQLAAAPPAPPRTVAPLPVAPRKAEADAVEVQAQASQVQVAPAVQQNSPGGPKQNATQSARAFAPANRAGKIARLAEPFGFHYSVETPGHLIVIPAADGYLTVKTSDGTTLFVSQRVAAGAVVDVVVPPSAGSLSMVFSTDASPTRVTPAVRTGKEGAVEAPAGGPSTVAIDLKVNQ